MKIALTKKKSKRKNEGKASFMTLLSEVKESHKKPPPLHPPLVSPSCESSTTRKDETYRRSRRPNSRIRRQMARKKKTSQQIIFNKIREKGKKEENDLPAYITKEHPDTYPRKIIQYTLYIH